MQLILLPQAIRAMLPVIIAQLVVTLKDTALGFIITYPELLYFAKTARIQRALRIARSSRPRSSPAPSTSACACCCPARRRRWRSDCAALRERSRPRRARRTREGITDTSLIVAQRDAPDLKG